MIQSGFGTGKSWYRKKSRNRYRKKIGIGTYFCRQHLGIFKIYNGYRYRIGAGTGKFLFFRWYRNRYRKILVPEKNFVAKTLEF